MLGLNQFNFGVNRVVERDGAASLSTSTFQSIPLTDALPASSEGQFIDCNIEATESSLFHKNTVSSFSSEIDSRLSRLSYQPSFDEFRAYHENQIRLSCNQVPYHGGPELYDILRTKVLPQEHSGNSASTIESSSEATSPPLPKE